MMYTIAEKSIKKLSQFRLFVKRCLHKKMINFDTKKQMDLVPVFSDPCSQGFPPRLNFDADLDFRSKSNRSIYKWPVSHWKKSICFLMLNSVKSLMDGSVTKNGPFNTSSSIFSRSNLITFLCGPWVKRNEPLQPLDFQRQIKAGWAHPWDKSHWLSNS